MHNFLRLTLAFLRDLTVGAYQIKLAPSYIQDNLLRGVEKELQLEVINKQHRDIIKESGFRNATRHQLGTAYLPTDQNEPNCDDDSIEGYYCTFKASARSPGTFAHVASVLCSRDMYDINIIYAIPPLNLIKQYLSLPTGNNKKFIIQNNCNVPNVSVTECPLSVWRDYI